MEVRCKDITSFKNKLIETNLQLNNIIGLEKIRKMKSDIFADKCFQQDQKLNENDFQSTKNAITRLSILQAIASPYSPLGQTPCEPLPQLGRQSRQPGTYKTTSTTEEAL